ncbi:unnamed protein product [Aphanomyces euteiches]
MSSHEGAKVFDVDPSTVRKWASKQAKYIEVPNKKSKNLPGAGRHKALPDPEALEYGASSIVNTCHQLQEAYPTCMAQKDVYNVDETAVYFDMPPRTIWSIRGGISALSAGEKHSM